MQSFLSVTSQRAMSEARPQVLHVIIPAHNEEQSIGTVLRGLLQKKFERLKIGKIIVVNNASSDRTADIARREGAFVVEQPRIGYGSACLRGMQEIGESDLVLFLDADGSDDLDSLQSIINPILDGQADFVVGSRANPLVDPGALLPHQQFGNWLAAALLQLLFNQKITDLGPCRAIRTRQLLELGMQDPDYGWTVEMQIRAIRSGLSYKEIAVPYHRRVAGKSKVAGSLKASLLAGYKILSLVFREYAFVLKKRVKRVLLGVHA